MDVIPFFFVPRRIRRLLCDFLTALKPSADEIATKVFAPSKTQSNFVTMSDGTRPGAEKLAHREYRPHEIVVQSIVEMKEER
jgi:hypothetical protein